MDKIDKLLTLKEMLAHSQIRVAYHEIKIPASAKYMRPLPEDLTSNTCHAYHMCKHIHR